MSYAVMWLIRVVEGLIVHNNSQFPLDASEKNGQERLV